MMHSEPSPASLPAKITAEAWYAYWNAMRRYHRFEVYGLENIDRCKSSMIVGYHGRGAAHDMIMLTALLRERSNANIRAIIHNAVPKLPVFKWLPEGLGYLTDDGPSMQALIARNESLMVTPGGSREGTRSFRDRYRVSWGNRMGYLRIALRYHLPIIPTAGAGVDDTFIGLNDGYQLGKRLHIPGNLPIWFAFGATGPWPFTAPFPVKINCIVGKPINLEADGPVDPNDEAALQKLHQRIMQTVQDQLDEARRLAKQPKRDEITRYP